MASISGFNRGEVLFPAEKRRVRVIYLGVPADYEAPMFLERGFTEEDLSTGISAIITDEFTYPNWPSEPFHHEETLRYVNVSNTGKAFRGNTDIPFSNIFN